MMVLERDDDEWCDGWKQVGPHNPTRTCINDASQTCYDITILFATPASLHIHIHIPSVIIPIHKTPVVKGFAKIGTKEKQCLMRVLCSNRCLTFLHPPQRTSSNMPARARERERESAVIDFLLRTAAFVDCCACVCPAFFDASDNAQ